jgi:DHA1 family bicyclomycin/chloramphenicol resistance-like MFS transporter
LSGSFITTRIGTRAANETMVLAGSVLVAVATAVQSVLLLNGYLVPLVLFAPGFVITLAQGISLSYAQAGAMATNPKLAGTAAGIGVFTQYFCGATLAQLYGILADGTPGPLMMTTALSALLGLIVGIVPMVAARAKHAAS